MKFHKFSLQNSFRTEYLEITKQLNNTNDRKSEEIIADD